MKQEIEKYTDDDQLVWKTLFDRQHKNLKEKGCAIYYDCLENMSPALNAKSVPDFNQIDKWFQQNTGWSIEVVPGLIPVSEFFDLLAEKRFCSSTLLRSMAQLDYLEEPDMFHDIFGHLPLLSDPNYSAFINEFGKLGKEYKKDEKAVLQLQRLYWYTIEFGIINEGSRKIYGAGIISSYGETNRVIDEDCNVIPFDIGAIFNKAFRTDVLQEDYFIIDSFDQLLKSLGEAELLLKD